MNTYIPCKEPDILISGRTKAARPLPLFWTGSGIEFAVDGSELYIDFTTDYDVYEQWVRVEINGFSILRTSLPKGKSSLCIYRNMKPENTRTVRLYKEVQPMRADKSGKLLVDAVRCDGSLKPLEEKKCKLEFIGDSITSGEGLGGAYGMSEFNSSIFSTYGNYAVTVANKLNADIRILSQSGWGVCSSWDNDPNRVLPRYYEQICGLLSDEDGTALETNDFAAWQPDTVLVNLGSNDGFAFYNKPWKDPETGKVFAQRLNADGSFEKESTDRFEKAVYDFLVQIRRCNPNARIVWIYGMIGRSMENYIKEAIARYAGEANDAKTDYLRLPDLKEEWIGANNHPGFPAHQAAAEVITEYLKKR